ncbi:MAG TPA: hypothetical protein VIA62_17610 [Thermoanaerobaculia bacterium]|jgi:hypothetical protein|nr:hypothetical protein [Thermoanaerobaculia bacterium]
MSRSLSIWTLALVLAFALLAAPATAEVFHVTLTNGTTVDSSVQPQQASWDPNMVMLLTEVGNWVGFPKAEVASIKAEDPTAGFGVRISSTAIALGQFSNDLPEAGKGSTQDDLNNRYLSLANKMLEQQERQQHYSVQQFVEPGQTQGIPAAFAGYGSGGLTAGGGGLGATATAPNTGPPPLSSNPMPPNQNPNQ